MRKSNRRIREALDSRLSVLDASRECKAHIRRRIMREEENMKGKNGWRMPCRMSVRAALVLAVVIALGSVAAAAAINIFDVYGGGDVRISALSQETMMQAEPTVIKDQHLGVITAAITNAYYDGTTLIFGYNIENAARLERYTPTEAQLAQAEHWHEAKSPYAFFEERYYQREEERALLNEFEEAIEQGRAFGVICYSVRRDVPSIVDGIYLGSGSENDEFARSDAHNGLIEIDSPLPEAARNQGVLNLSIALRRNVLMVYFDGEEMYSGTLESEPIGEMVAAIERTEAQSVRYEGTGIYRGAEVQADIELSQVAGVLTLRAQDEVFKYNSVPLLVEIKDAQGRVIDLKRLYDRENTGFICEFDGNFTLPEEMRVHLLMEYWLSEDEMIPYETEIVLKPVK